MHLFHPIQEEYCEPFVGRYVCAVLEDGTRHIGILSGVGKGKLILNDQAGTASFDEEEAPGNSAKKKKKKGRKSETSVLETNSRTPAAPYGYGPSPFSAYGSRVAVDLSSVSLLFLLTI